MKRCRCCQIEKPLSDFYVHNDSADGHFASCKECTKRRARERFRDKTDAVRETRRKYRKTERGKRLEKIQRKRYLKNNPQQLRARRAVKELLPPATERKCYHCGVQASDWHHHNGYSREHRLDVIPLCKPCHIKADAVQRSQKSCATTR